MAKEGKAYLKDLVTSIEYPSDAFTLKLANGKRIFSISTKNPEISDYFAISAIYDSICEIDQEIKFAFSRAISLNIPHPLMDHKPFSKPSSEEALALYHTKNIVFRVSVLWDMLAQLCNVIFHTENKKNKERTEKIYYAQYFNNHAQGKKALVFAKEVNDYLRQEEGNADINPWPGNHAFLNKYRNDMTHNVSPNATSFSTLGVRLRPPTMYVLHRTVEDYSVVSAFLQRLITEYLTKYSERDILENLS